MSPATKSSRKPARTAQSKPQGDWQTLRREWRATWKVIVGMLAVLWTVELVDLYALGGRLDAYSVRPRELDGLLGILTHPFLHGGLPHLISNSAGILVLGTLVAARSRWAWLWVSLAGTLLGGLGMWLLGASGSVHIGASGVVFAYFGYLLFAGWFERRFASMLLSALVLLVYGTMIFGVLPGQVGVSWEGHLFGFFAGVIMARVLAKRADH
ncbi:rhomboid family intramembrane serine protease [Pseudenhygromyxa sp. WMMC2535]|uniref:rhomboid family intramembrane serine protease n=1 Tax=Pseudenhygromyxa sp. WMMC2535 TaxID=2712867 RepID=UPI0015577EF4|nr:rhomboid family intramembrane serine protease [Pseudenhygromyxa sp. WMMC2535]NVB36769.1 rhomboid family intramembrane serine protease [Pseudenhygromyxa sp. WMMC2535]